MKVAVIGGAGYIGSFTTLALREAGHEAIVIDDLSSGHKEAIKGFPLLEIDILNERERLLETFQKERFDAVIHFAALISVGESVKNPGLYFRHNVCGSLNVIEAAATAGVEKFVFSSTAAVYGDPEILPIPETHPLRPKNPYGESKLMVEKILGWYWESCKLPSVSIRYFNAAGASLDGKMGDDHPVKTHLIPNIVFSVLEGRKLTVFGNDYPTPDGTCIRDYIHVLDLASVHVKALNYLDGKQGAFTFNAGTGRGYSNLEVLRMAEKVSGRPVEYNFGGHREGDVAQLIADPGTARKELSWEPSFSDLETIIKSAWLWHTQNPKGYSGV